MRKLVDSIKDTENSLLEALNTVEAAWRRQPENVEYKYIRRAIIDALTGLGHDIDYEFDALESALSLRQVLIQKGLSNRESEVSELVAKGLSNREIGNHLFVTEKTVLFHLTNIYKKLNVVSRAQLIVHCLPHMQ